VLATRTFPESKVRTFEDRYSLRHWDHSVAYEENVSGDRLRMFGSQIVPAIAGRYRSILSGQGAVDSPALNQHYGAVERFRSNAAGHTAHHPFARLCLLRHQVHRLRRYPGISGISQLMKATTGEDEKHLDKYIKDDRSCAST
jgi:hypothetical protein